MSTTPGPSRSPRLRSAGARAFTLIEALIATGILSMSVLALSSAVAAGQKSSIEGQKMVLASMAVSDLMSELMTVSYGQLKGHDGRTETPGQMRTLDGGYYPNTYWMIGRVVSATDQTVTEPGLGVTIRGVKVVVSATDGKRTLLSAEAFVPEPGS